jgi:hypothetical protein
VWGILVAMKPKVDPGHLAADLLVQAGASGQVFGCGESGEKNGLVGEITIFTLGFDQLRFVGLNLAFQFPIVEH